MNFATTSESDIATSTAGAFSSIAFSRNTRHAAFSRMPGASSTTSTKAPRGADDEMLDNRLIAARIVR
ncbi:hypothetical protein C0Z17_02750 [Trinickia caryophylli]|nr:hypothetical protein C0Z17_02750 [Trinickia caryophylli]